MMTKIAVVNTFGIVGGREGCGRAVAFAPSASDAMAMMSDAAFRASLPAFEQGGQFLASIVEGDAELGDVRRVRRPALATVREHGRTFAVYQQPYTYMLVEWTDGGPMAIGTKRASEYLMSFNSIDEAVECARGLLRGEARSVRPLHRSDVATVVAP